MTFSSFLGEQSLPPLGKLSIKEDKVVLHKHSMITVSSSEPAMANVYPRQLLILAALTLLKRMEFFYTPFQTLVEFPSG